MPHAVSIATRFASVIERAVSRRHKGGGLFARIVMALHVSRRLEAQRVLRSYRHLITEDFEGRPKGILLDFKKAKEGKTDANRGQTRVRARHRT
jgi:hypothetical protein